MTEWTIVSVIVVLVGLIVSVIKPVIGLTQTITKLNVSVDALSEKVEDVTTRNAESHDRIFKKLESHDNELSEHDKRIGMLEHTPQ